MLPLESVPNVSEGREADAIATVGAAFGSRARLLDVHSDVDHNRSVFTRIHADCDGHGDKFHHGDKRRDCRKRSIGDAFLSECAGFCYGWFGF